MNNTNSAEAVSQHLSFHLSEEIFAIPIEKVREVLDFHGATKVPQMPAYMRGVINLRGAVVPVIDLKLKFGLGFTQRDLDTCVVIVEILEGTGGTVVLGLMADSMREVMDMSDGQIEPAPRIGTKLNTEYLRGMGRTESGLVLMLDIDRIFGDELLNTSAASAPNFNPGTDDNEKGTGN